MVAVLLRFQLCCLLFSFAFAANAEVLSLYVTSAEGGRQSQGNIVSLEKYLAQQGCYVAVGASASINLADLVFNARPAELLLSNSSQKFSSTQERGESLPYEPLVAVRTWQDYPLTSAVLVKSSTGLTNLAGLKGQRIAYISEDAYMGRQVAEQLMSTVNVQPRGNSIYLTGGYEGSMTMLLHGDVFSAVIAGPLAHRWAKANDLTVVVESDPLDIGYLWIRASLAEDIKTVCRNAMLALQRESRRDKRMKVFPLWVEGFKPVTVH
ncbi:MAG: PhnD/SsuA/transferrin family substrate-binding protein [Amphritea sp.]